MTDANLTPPPIPTTRSAIADRLATLDMRLARTVGIVLLILLAISAVFWASAKVIGLSDDGLLAQAFAAVVASWLAVPVVVAAFTAASFIGAPQFLLIAVTVAAFGPVYGLMLSYAATLVSASTNFWLARWLGAEWLARIGLDRVDTLISAISRNGFMAAMLVRVVPSGPFIVVNGALGISGTPYAAFLAGTAVGILPKTALIAVLGKVVERAIAGDATAMVYLISAALLWVALAVGARWGLQQRERQLLKAAGSGTNTA